MDTFFTILQRPIVTERATNLRALANQYLFRVALEASKSDIKAAVEKLFKVQVISVNTMRVRGKFRRMGSGRGAHRPAWKKAVITLKAGQEIKAAEDTK